MSPNLNIYNNFYTDDDNSCKSSADTELSCVYFTMSSIKHVLNAITRKIFSIDVTEYTFSGGDKFYNIDFSSLRSRFQLKDKLRKKYRQRKIF